MNNKEEEQMIFSTLGFWKQKQNKILKYIPAIKNHSRIFKINYANQYAKELVLKKN